MLIILALQKQGLHSPSTPMCCIMARINFSLLEKECDRTPYEMYLGLDPVSEWSMWAVGSKPRKSSGKGKMPIVNIGKDGDGFSFFRFAFCICSSGTPLKMPYLWFKNTSDQKTPHGSLYWITSFRYSNAYWYFGSQGL